MRLRSEPTSRLKATQKEKELFLIFFFKNIFLQCLLTARILESVGGPDLKLLFTCNPSQKQSSRDVP